MGKPSDGISTLANTARLHLLDARFKMVIDDYKVKGTPKTMIDTFDDLTNQEKAALYDRAVMWKKALKPKSNPYLAM